MVPPVENVATSAPEAGGGVHCLLHALVVWVVNRDVSEHTGTWGILPYNEKLDLQKVQ